MRMLFNRGKECLQLTTTFKPNSFFWLIYFKWFNFFFSISYVLYISSRLEFLIKYYTHASQLLKILLFTSKLTKSTSFTLLALESNLFCKVSPIFYLVPTINKGIESVTAVPTQSTIWCMWGFQVSLWSHQPPRHLIVGLVRFK